MYRRVPDNENRITTLKLNATVLVQHTCSYVKYDLSTKINLGFMDLAKPTFHAVSEQCDVKGAGITSSWATVTKPISRRDLSAADRGQETYLKTDSVSCRVNRIGEMSWTSRACIKTRGARRIWNRPSRVALVCVKTLTIALILPSRSWALTCRQLGQNLL